MGLFTARPPISRTGYASGRIAGLLLADTLSRVIDGAAPRTIVGASRDAQDNAAVVVFPDGGLHEAERWLETRGINDPVLVQVDSHGGDVSVHVPNVDGDGFAISAFFNFRVGPGGLATSLPGFIITGDGDELFEPFQDGLAAGLEEHPRTAELLPGFGALGDYGSHS